MLMSSVMGVLGSIPSPGDNAINIGPLQLRAYGLAIALGVLAAAALARRRWQAAGHDPEDINRLAVWVVPAGLVGARLYHVATDWHRFYGEWFDVVKVWEGGLGIPGGLLGGVAVGFWVAKRRGMPVPELLDVVAPAIPVAQAIGRLGNWFNQELFGGPTDLPWGLEIDAAHRPDDYADVTTFHPTFLYEALWNLALAGLLIWVGRRWAPRAGQLFLGYIVGYGAGRFWVEALRIDPATEVLGLRINLWVSGIVFAVALVALLIRARQAPDAEDAEPVDDSDAAGNVDAAGAEDADDAGASDATEKDSAEPVSSSD